MPTLIGKEHLDLRAAVAKETTRYSLCNLLVTKDRVCASNGKVVLAVPTVPGGEDFPLLEGCGEDLVEGDRIIVKPEAIEKALRSVGKNKNIPLLSCVAVTKQERPATEDPDGKDIPTPPTVILSATDLESTSNIRSQSVEGIFPDVDEAIPKQNNKDRILLLNAEQLKIIVDFVNTHGKEKIPTIRFQVPEKSCATIRIDFDLADGRKCVGAIAECREFD